MDFQLDADTNDLVLVGGDIVLASGLQAVAQRIKDRLQTFLGEWFLDRDFGPPYLDDVLIKNPSLTLVRSILLAQAELSLNDEAVITDFEVTLELASRELEVAFTLREPDAEEEVQATVVIG